MNHLNEPISSVSHKNLDLKLNFVENENCRVICRQQPLHGKAIGFKQQYGNFLYAFVYPNISYKIKHGFLRFYDFLSRDLAYYHHNPFFEEDILLIVIRDPILILELKLLKENRNRNLNSLNYVCIVELVEHYTKIQRSTVIVGDKIQIDKYSGELKTVPHRYQINLRGTKTNCGDVFRDIDTGLKSKFFVFNDLAVRTMGKYRLRASIFDMDRPGSNGLTLYTKPFEVQSARNYGARIGPTKLMQALAVQGNLAIGRKHRNAKKTDANAEELLAGLKSSDESSSLEGENEHDLQLESLHSAHSP